MRMVLLWLVVAACGNKHDAPEAKPAPVEPPAPVATRSDEPSQQEIEDEAAKMTKGAVPPEQLAPFVPRTLGGVALSNRMEQAWAYAAAYKLDDGGYANLDIQNTFIRGTGDDSIVRLTLDNPKLCPKRETIAGASACIDVAADHARIFWYLPDRLTVRLAAPTEKLVHKMAADLRIADLAKLSAAK